MPVLLDEALLIERAPDLVDEDEALAGEVQRLRHLAENPRDFRE